MHGVPCEHGGTHHGEGKFSAITVVNAHAQLGQRINGLSHRPSASGEIPIDVGGAGKQCRHRRHKAHHSAC